MGWLKQLLSQKQTKQEQEIETLKRTANELNNLKQFHIETIESMNEKVRNLTKENEKQRLELEVLYRYFRLNEEPPEDIRVKAIIDLENHELRMENYKLQCMLDRPRMTRCK